MKIPSLLQKGMLNYEIKLLDTHVLRVEEAIRDRDFKSRGFLNMLKRVWSLRAEAEELKEAVSLFDTWTGSSDDLVLSWGIIYGLLFPG